jgi:serine/threonine protein kinase
VLFGTTNVAIKVVRSPTPAQQTSFIKEIMILKACRHPNVISFLGASIQAQQTLMVMEAMPGGDLYTQIEKDTTGLFTWYQRGLPPRLSANLEDAQDKDKIWLGMLVGWWVWLVG